MRFSDLSADTLCQISNYMDNPLFYPLDSLSTSMQKSIYSRYDKSSLQLGIDFINKPMVCRLIYENDKTIKSFIKLINKVFNKYSNNNVIKSNIFNKFLEKLYNRIHFNKDLFKMNKLRDIKDLLHHKNLTIKGHKDDLIHILSTYYNNCLSGLNYRHANINSLNNLTHVTKIIITKVIGLKGDISSLSRLQNLTVLRLRGSVSGDIASLSELRNLTELNLVLTQVSGDIVSLSELRNVKNLYLNNTHLCGDIGVLIELQNLKRLCFKQSNITNNERSLKFFKHLIRSSLY